GERERCFGQKRFGYRSLIVFGGEFGRTIYAAGPPRHYPAQGLDDGNQASHALTFELGHVTGADQHHGQEQTQYPAYLSRPMAP
ncbi:MAG: hypothetical protein OSA92_05265, partial [Pirellulaceae bacterium]|nr:hypothetical protein [Pirellulaceae bacterium]